MRFPILPALTLLLVVGVTWGAGRANSEGALVGNVSPPQVFHGEPYSESRLALSSPRKPATGPLKVCSENPRYFCNPAGQAVYLTGSHNWSNLKDRGKTDPPPHFDFQKYLDFLVSHNHNFIRLWTWALTKRYDTYSTPFPWMRTGPGMALDGKPRFDLRRFNQAYFDRLRSRIIAARQKGIYVSVMLFEGYSLQFWPWEGHPFNARNNINGIDGDKNHDDSGTEVVMLQLPKVTELQEAYVRKVIETVNDLDNVLYEVANEAGANSTAWQYHMIRFIKRVEAGKPKQHPVGMTFQYRGGTNGALFASPADWISPGLDSYKINPKASQGRKVILSDTDHLWGNEEDPDWVWESFTRGLNPIYMDKLSRTDSKERVRTAMGDTLAYANRINLLKMTPHEDLASSGYCLAEPGVEYMAFAPAGGVIVMQLGNASGDFSVEWFSPRTQEIYQEGTAPGGNLESFRAPFSGPAVLHLKSVTSVLPK